MNLFFQQHNGILSHLNLFWMYYDPIFMEIMGNQTIEFLHFLPIFGQLRKLTVVFEVYQTSPVFQLLILGLWNTFRKNNYRRKSFIYMESTLLICILNSALQTYYTLDVKIHCLFLYIYIYMSGSAKKCVQALKLVFSNKITQIPIAMFLFFTQILET